MLLSARAHRHEYSEQHKTRGALALAPLSWLYAKPLSKVHNLSGWRARCCCLSIARVWGSVPGVGWCGEEPISGSYINAHGKMLRTGGIQSLSFPSKRPLRAWWALWWWRWFAWDLWNCGERWEGSYEKKNTILIIRSMHAWWSRYAFFASQL